MHKVDLQPQGGIPKAAAYLRRPHSLTFNSSVPTFTTEIVFDNTDSLLSRSAVVLDSYAPASLLGPGDQATAG